MFYIYTICWFSSYLKKNRKNSFSFNIFVIIFLYKKGNIKFEIKRKNIPFIIKIIVKIVY
nr:MAG TPA: hypothetical protein [Caudoviricetes sp.]